MALEAGQDFDPGSPDILRRLQMGFFPEGAAIIPNAYNRIPGFSLEGRVHFLPGFPVMAWPMMAWALAHLDLDQHGKAMLVIGLSDIGDRELAGRTLDQPHSQSIFKRCDAAAELGVLQSQCPGCRG